jgi:hypothetical protein
MKAASALSVKRHKRAQAAPRARVSPVHAARLRTALAVGAVALLPALVWQAGDVVPSPAIAAPVPAAVVKPAAVSTETVIGKAASTWTHKKADRLGGDRPVHNGPQIIATPGQPDTIVEVISLAADDGDDALREAEDFAAREAERAGFADWLTMDRTTGAVRITGFKTKRSGGGRTECRSTHDSIVRAFDISADQARVMADKPVMFQSSICAANGEIVITCHGATALVSPRRARPGSMCAKG